MLRPDQSTRRTTAHRGFTLIEMMIALALSTLVVGGVISLLGMIRSAESRQSQRYEEMMEASIAQRTVRKAMMTLVAAPPPPEPDETGDDDDDDDFEDMTEEERRQLLGEEFISDEQMQDLERGTRSRDADSREAAMSELIEQLLERPDSPLPHFELYYEEYEGVVLPRLEIVLMQSPVPVATEPAEIVLQQRSRVEPQSEEELRAQRVARLLAQSRGTVRGAFELMLYEDGWALQWTPVDPPGRPYILVRNVIRCEWWLLPRGGATTEDGERQVKEYTNIGLAYEMGEFPLAVRLILETESGMAVDWLFETDIAPAEE